MKSFDYNQPKFTYWYFISKYHISSKYHKLCKRAVCDVLLINTILLLNRYLYSEIPLRWLLYSVNSKPIERKYTLGQWFILLVSVNGSWLVGQVTPLILVQMLSKSILSVHFPLVPITIFPAGTQWMYSMAHDMFRLIFFQNWASKRAIIDFYIVYLQWSCVSQAFAIKIYRNVNNTNIAITSPWFGYADLFVLVFGGVSALCLV